MVKPSQSLQSLPPHQQQQKEPLAGVRVNVRRPGRKIKVEPPQHRKNRLEDKDAGMADARLKTMIFF